MFYIYKKRREKACVLLKRFLFTLIPHTFKNIRKNFQPLWRILLERNLMFNSLILFFLIKNSISPLKCFNCRFSSYHNNNCNDPIINDILKQLSFVINSFLT